MLFIGNFGRTCWALSAPTAGCFKAGPHGQWSLSKKRTISARRSINISVTLAEDDSRQKDPSLEAFGTKQDQESTLKTASAPNVMEPHTTSADGLGTGRANGLNEDSSGFPLHSQMFGKKMDIPNALEFFRLREGDWLSKRMTHHMAFRRQENGESHISVKLLEADDERIRQLCAMHNYAEDAAMGGCFVSWRATLQWDQEGDAHEGEAVFALVAAPNSNGRRGKILRDRGYAEVVPIAGDFDMDEDDSLVLVTPYEGGEVTEQFFYEGTDRLFRFSTVKRMGGFSNVTYAVETRIPNNISWEGYESEMNVDDLSIFGISTTVMDEENENKEKTSRRFGLGNSRLAEKLQGTLGKRIDIDESKLPPSLRTPPSKPEPGEDSPQ
jgi:hypothetical protein